MTSVQNISPVVRIRYYTHFFTVEPLTPRITGVLFNYLQEYVEKVWFQERGSKPRLVPGKVYAGRTQDNREFRLHRGQLKGFIDALMRYGVDDGMVESIYMDRYKPTTYKFKLADGRTLRDYQLEAREFAVNSGETDFFSSLIAMPTGSGKEQSLNSLIKIPGGWATMGSMKVGTEVTAWDGTTTTVKGVYPQGIKDNYRITFSDGRTAEAGGEHLWRIFTADRSPVWRVVDTKEMMRLKTTTNSRVHIQLYDPKGESDIPEDLPLDPYILGLMLGNGGMTGIGITYATQDQCTVDKINYNLNPFGIEVVKGDRYNHRFRKMKDYQGTEMETGHMLAKIKKLGLYGLPSFEKKIPVVYLDASRSQRLALVQGLLDTDGTTGKLGDISFCTTSIIMARQFQYLIRSLGGICYMSSKIPHYTYNGERKIGRRAYTLSVRYKTPNELFQVERKRQRVSDTNQYSEGLKLRVDKVELIGQEEMQCIAIDHPDHLYVTNDFVVTHNTVTLCGIAESIGQNLAIAVLPRYMEKWGGDLVENLGLKKKDIMMVSGSKQVKGLIHMVKHGSKPPFATIFSLVTLQGFFDLYEQDPKLCLEEYGAIPQDIWKLLGIGLVGVDEAHEHLYSVFRLTLHLHGPKLVALSGTMLSEDHFIDKIQKTIFPHTVRFDKIKMKKYIKLIPLAYEFQDMRRYKIKTSAFGRTTYSQVEYEKSIIKNQLALGNYIAMIKDIVNMGYIDKKMEGDKLAIYCGSIDMCTRVTNHLKQCYPHLDVRRYVEQDPYKNVIEADIRVTTIISAGTAVDIPNLRCLINTNNISSHKANFQVLGRLRELKDRDVKMYYMYCEQIPKHVQYHQQKMEIYEDRVASIHCLKLPHRL